MERLAVEHAKGRRIIVGTTWLDVLRPVVWDLGAMASSGAPDAYDRIVDVLLASTGVPGLLPPVLFTSGKSGMYGELHADGGLSKLEFLEPYAARMESALKLTGYSASTTVYLLHNDRIKPQVNTVQPEGVLAAAFNSLFRANGFYALSTIFQETRADGELFQLAAIPDDFDLRPKEAFDRAYMSALYQRAFDEAKGGPAWMPYPPPYPALSGLQQRLLQR